MATLSQYPPTLHITSADDDMEISSQVGHYDHDIDIDLDIPSDNVGDQDVLLDDVRSEGEEASVLHDQDMLQDIDNAMYDEDGEGAGDEGAADAIDFTLDDKDATDEHLADASVDGIINTPEVIVEDMAEQQRYEEEHVQIADLDFGDVSQDNALHPDDHEVAPTSFQYDVPQDDPLQHDEFGHTFDDALDDAGVENEREREQESLADTTKEASVSLAPGTGSAQPILRSENALEQTAEEQQEDGASTDRASDESRISLTADVVTHTDTDISGRATDTATTYNGHNTRAEQLVTHPITVSYDNARFSLFPPTNNDESTQFLLSDSSLCSRSLVDLMRACREVLGDDISDEQELRLHSQDLDLEISEESAHAFSTSLAEILEVYLDLNHLDGVDVPEALEVSLVKKERFTAGLSRLRAAVADGRGMSRLWEDWDDDDETHLEVDGSPDRLEAANEDHDDQPVNEQANDGLSKQPVQSGVGDAAIYEEGPGNSQREVPAIDDQEVHEGTLAVHENHGSIAHTPEDDYGHERLKEKHQVTDVQSENRPENNTGSGLTVQEESAELGDEDLIDYAEDEPVEVNRSSDSSTVADDGVRNDDDVDANAAERQGTGITEAQKLQLHPQGHQQDEVYLDQPEEQEFQELESDTQFMGNLHGAQRSGDAQESPSGAGSGHSPDPDDIDWLDPPVEAAAADDITDLAQHGDQQHEEDWDRLLDGNDQQGSEVAAWANEDPDGHCDDSPAAAPIREAGADQDTATTHALGDEVFDDEDEITFDVGEVELGLEGNASHEEQPSVARQPSESPTGKRSLTEHLEGDGDGHGSDTGATVGYTSSTQLTDAYPEAKRLRST